MSKISQNEHQIVKSANRLLGVSNRVFFCTRCEHFARGSRSYQPKCGEKSRNRWEPSQARVHHGDQEVDQDDLCHHQVCKHHDRPAEQEREKEKEKETEKEKYKEKEKEKEKEKDKEKHIQKENREKEKREKEREE